MLKSLPFGNGSIAKKSRMKYQQNAVLMYANMWKQKQSAYDIVFIELVELRKNLSTQENNHAL